MHTAEATNRSHDATRVTRARVVNQDGIVFEKDLGSETGAGAEKVTTSDPDKTWQPIR